MFCARTRFWRYRGCRFPFSCFAHPDAFSTVPRASGLDFIFCALGLDFGGTMGVGSCFHVLRAPIYFRRYRGRRVPFSLFFVPGLVFGGTEGVGSRFLILRSRTYFRRFRGRWVLFSSFAHPYSFSVVPRASSPVFMFCAPGHVFDGTEGVGSRFHVLRSRTYFLRYGGRRVPFSCFARPGSFSAETRVSGPIFMFSAPRDIFRGTEGIGSHFHALCTRTRFRLYRGHRVPFSCLARPYSFSCFALLD
jgi:hypothetical protein